MKADVIAMTGSSSGSWAALCQAHRARYWQNYGKTVKVDPGFWYDCTPPECVACELAADLERRHRGGYIDLNDMRDISRRAGSHWFDESTMRCFASQVPDAGRFIPGDHLTIAFISSEKFRGFRSADGPRCYTVRLMDCLTGNTSEDPKGFQGYATLKAARKGLERVLVAGRVQVAA